MKYSLTNKQDKKSASTGKEFVSATLTDEQGVEYTGVNAFNGEFSADAWHGELVQNGNYWNLVTPKQSAGNNFKTQQMEKVMERKEQGIIRSQDNKDYSIRTSSSMNKAIEIAIAEYGNPKNLYTMEESILKWREWIWTHWEDVDKFPPFN